MTVFDPTITADGDLAGWVSFNGFTIGKWQADVPNRFVVSNGSYINWYFAADRYDTPTIRADHIIEVEAYIGSGDSVTVFFNMTSDSSQRNEFKLNSDGTWELNYDLGGMASGSGLAITPGVMCLIRIDATTSTTPLIEVNGVTVYNSTPSNPRTGLYVGVGMGSGTFLGVIDVTPTGGGPVVADAPTSVVATAGNAQVGLTWTAGASDGGAAVTDHVIEYRPLWPSAVDVLDPVRRWPFTETSGTSITDAIVGEVSTTTAEGSTNIDRSVTGPGQTGNAIGFTNTDPDTDAYANLGTFDSLGTEAIINFSWFAKPGTNFADVWATGDLSGGDPTQFPIILFEQNGHSAYGPIPGGVGMFYGIADFTDPFNSPTSLMAITGDIGIDDGNWHHFLWQINTTTNAFTLWVDGVSQTLTSLNVNSPNIGSIGTWLPLLVGQGQNGPGNNPQGTFGATTDIDEFTGIAGALTTADALRICNAGFGNWTTFSHATNPGTSITVTGLVNDVSYQFRVSAVNSAGTSAPSSTSNTATPSAPVPDAPIIEYAKGWDGKVHLVWTIPADNGSAITDYVVEYAVSPFTSWSTFTDGTSTTPTATVTGLTNATTYRLRVSAVNANGTGLPSSYVTVIPDDYSTQSTQPRFAYPSASYRAVSRQQAVRGLYRTQAEADAFAALVLGDQTIIILVLQGWWGIRTRIQ